MEVKRRLGSIFLSQRLFTEKIVELAGMTSAKQTDLPLSLSHPLHEQRKVWIGKDIAAMNEVSYREVLGSLLVLATHTLPDQSTAVFMDGEHQEVPLTDH